MDEMANHATRVRRLDRQDRRREGRGLHRPVPVAREPDRPPLAASSARNAGPEAGRGRGEEQRAASRASRSTASTCAATSTRPRSSSRSARRSRTRSSEGEASSPSARSATCCCSCSSTRRSSRWERDVLAIIREEAYYFAPQGQTKIMNEGWASYWHSHDHDRRKALDAIARSSTTPTTTRARWPPSPGALNPYKLGIELFRDIEDRWNKGRFGKEWDECDDLRARRALGQEAGPGPPEDLRGAQALQRRHLHRRRS